MDFDSLKQFVDLASNRHFAKTSEQHHISASTLSRSIQRLERSVGYPLLQRNNRSVKLTAAGEQFLLFANETLARWQHTRRELVVRAELLSGEVSLFCSVTASHSLISTILSELRDSQPGIDIKLHTGDQAVSLLRLQQGEEDMVIAARPDSLPAEIEFKTLARSRLVFIAPRSLLADSQYEKPASKLTNKWLAGQPWILAERGLLRERLDIWFQQRAIQPRVYAQVAGHEAIVSMVALGCGIGVVPELVLTNSPLRDSIDLIAIEESMLDFDIGLCVLEKRLSEPVMSAVWQNVRSQA